MIESTAYDLRHAFRTLRQSPAFTLTSVVVLALAIGANTAMFSVLNAVLFRPLPYKAPEQLAMLWTEVPSQSLREGRSAYWNVEQWRTQSKSFADMAVSDGLSLTLTSAEGAEQVSVARISPNFFPLLGVQPLHGRLFSNEEAEQRQRLVLISYRFWQSRFAGSREALGASVELDRLPSRIIGVMPPSFQFADADIWEPHTLFPDWETRRAARGVGSWLVIGRLQPGVTGDQAQAEMNTISAQLDMQRSAGQLNRGVAVVPLGLQLTGQSSRLALWTLAGAVLFVLLIAATNVASLSLARSASRAGEMAIRAALGASRMRLVRQLLAESLALSALAGVVGWFVASVLIDLVLALKPTGIARIDEVGLDTQALGAGLAFSALTAIVVGVAPAITLARRDLAASARRSEGKSVSAGTTARSLRQGLVVTQFALAIMLLIGAGLLIRSLSAAENVALGFRPEGILSLQLAAPASATTTAQRAEFHTRVLSEIQSLPNVESAGIVGDFFIGGASEQIVTAKGERAGASESLRLRRDEVSERFFETIGARLLAGRYFSREDGPRSAPAAIVNRTMARRLWGNRDPVGRQFQLGPVDAGGPSFTVVGIVEDMRRQGLEQEPVPQMFEPLVQNPSRLATVLVRTRVGDPLTLAGSIRAAVSRVDKQAPVYHVTTLENRLGGFLAKRRFQTWLLTGLAGVALLIAAIGIYGLMQYSVTLRTRELAIRMAIGARSGELSAMIVGEGLKLSLLGLVLGVVGALWIGKAISTLMYGVTPTDPWTFAAVSVLLIAVATAASYLPARRAVKLDAAAALRKI